MIPTEEQEQIAVVEYMELLGLRYTHAANGANKSKAVAGKMKAAGQSAGFPDLIIVTPPPCFPAARGVAIEMKRKKNGRVTQEQRNWLDYMESVGWIARVCYGADEAIDFINSLWYMRSFRRVRGTEEVAEFSHDMLQRLNCPDQAGEKIWHLEEWSAIECRLIENFEALLNAIKSGNYDDVRLDAARLANAAMMSSNKVKKSPTEGGENGC